MEQLFEFNHSNLNNPLLHGSSNGVFYDYDGDIYIDLEDFIFRRAVDPDQLERRW